MIQIRRNINARRMTLVELLATVAVLTALAAAAIAGLGDLASRTRQTNTNTTGYAVRSNVVGQSGRYSAFLSDMGRLPVVQSSDEGKGLGELYTPPTNQLALLYDASMQYTNTSWDGAVEVKYQTSLQDMTVALPCGWRGPYLVNSSGSLYDGWGNDWQVNTGTNAVPVWSVATEATVLGKPFTGIRSLGRDNTEDSGTTSWEDEDKVFSFEDNLTTATLTVQFYVLSGGVYVAVDTALLDHLLVAVYAPYATDSTLAIKRVLANNNTATVITPVETTGFEHTESAAWSADNATVYFSGLRPGVRQIFALGYNLNGALVEGGVSSGVQLIELNPGGNVIKLYLSQELKE